MVTTNLTHYLNLHSTRKWHENGIIMYSADGKLHQLLTAYILSILLNCLDGLHHVLS